MRQIAAIRDRLEDAVGVMCQSISDGGKVLIYTDARSDACGRALVEGLLSLNCSDRPSLPAVKLHRPQHIETGEQELPAYKQILTLANSVDTLVLIYQQRAPELTSALQATRMVGNKGVVILPEGQQISGDPALIQIPLSSPAQPAAQAFWLMTATLLSDLVQDVFFGA
jgi:hypothetical protein